MVSWFYGCDPSDTRRTTERWPHPSHAFRCHAGVADVLAVNLGCEMLKIVPGRVSTEVDAHLSYNTQASTAVMIDARPLRASHGSPGRALPSNCRLARPPVHSMTALGVAALLLKSKRLFPAHIRACRACNQQAVI